MSGKKAPTEPFIMLPRSLVMSDAWRSLGINGRRVVDFLILEHLSHGGKENGNLKAPQHQLEEFGISSRYITGAIKEVEERGLIGCCRGGMRVATTYSLTWMATKDGAPASNQWRDFIEPDLRPLRPKIQKSAPQREGSAALQREGRSHQSALQSEGR